MADSDGLAANKPAKVRAPLLQFSLQMSELHLFLPRRELTFTSYVSSGTQPKTIVIKFPAIKSRAFHLVKVLEVFESVSA